MKIERIHTVRIAQYPQLVYVLIETDEGLQGLGETFSGAEAVSAYTHETAAPKILGKDPLQVDAHSHTLRRSFGWNGNGVETRGNSAIDIALWDLWGKVTDQPVYQLLGGRARESIRTYNTCAGYGYVRQPRFGDRSSNWGVAEPTAGPYEDLHGFLNHPAELAESLLGQGITAMKIWPFDLIAVETGGRYITAAQINQGLNPLRRIRDAVGDRMDVMLEFHSLWNLPSAQRIAAAASQEDPYWFEDLMPADDFEALAKIASTSSVPHALSETLSGLTTWRRLLASGAAGIAMLDVGWVGGITVSKEIAGLAAAHQIPVAPHDCTGPVVLTASTHLCAHLDNALVQESVRAFYTSWYQDLVTHLPLIVDGQISPPDGPGLGLELQPEVLRRSDTTIRTSSVNDL